MMIMETILILNNFLVTIASIIGAIVWAYYRDIFIYSDVYGFAWFVYIVSILFGILYVLYHRVESLKQMVKESYFNLFFTMVSFVLCVFWLATAAGIAQITNECVTFNSYFKNSGYNRNCSGEIISTLFGFLGFLVWLGIIIIYSIKSIHNIRPSLVSPSNNNQPIIEHPVGNQFGIEHPVIDTDITSGNSIMGILNTYGTYGTHDTHDTPESEEYELQSRHVTFNV
jgi:hypothetical protein